MKKTITTSDSLIGSLCREVEQLRLRNKNIIYSLNSCKDDVLRKRLNNEVNSLNKRLKELKLISYEFLQESKSSISKLLFFELCNRPIEYSM